MKNIIELSPLGI